MMDDSVDTIILDDDFDFINEPTQAKLNYQKDSAITLPDDIIIDVDEWEDEKAKSLYQSLEGIFPDASPDFLLGLCDIASFPNQNLDSMINELLTNKNYPKKENSKPKSEIEPRDTVDTSHRDSVTAFLKKFKDPYKSFTERKGIGNLFSISSHAYLRDKFKFMTVRTINQALSQTSNNLTMAFFLLLHMESDRVSKRQKDNKTVNYLECLNQDFLNEIFFLDNYKEIEETMQAAKLRLQEAKLNKELLECLCCYSDELFPEDVMTCIEGHIFCNECVRRSVEIAFSEGKYKFNCLTDCESHFNIESLKEVISSKLYRKIEGRIQEAEIKLANIGGICFCPYCDYAEVLPDDDRIFNCKVCLKESCRYCQEESHLPLSCDEYKDTKLKNSKRIEIEAKMTDALVRECYNCKKKFIKMDGCNKMRCVCGATMCYICRQPVKDYSHFDNSRNYPNQPSTSTYVPIKCPLYSNNNELHVDAIIAVAQDAVEKVKRDNPHLIIDTKTLTKGLKRKHK